MPRSSRKTEDTKIWLHRLSKTDLQTLKAQIDSRLHELSEREAGCRLLKLPPELRNTIYRMVAVDYARTAFNMNLPNLNAPYHEPRRQKFQEPFSLALTNKQISGEYLSILNSEEAASAQIYDQQAASKKWIDIDIRKLLRAVRSETPRHKYRRDGMEQSSQRDVFLPGRIFRSAAEAKVKLAEGSAPQGNGYYRGLVRFGGEGGRDGCLRFLLRTSAIEYYYS